MISHRCQYALRALFELSKRRREPAIRIADIADAQAIPHRFLEVILSQLKQGGFVSSQRGNQGGYTLARDPRDLTVGEVVRFIEGPIGPVGCVADGQSTEKCPLEGTCVFLPMWQRVRDAISEVYDTTTFADLVEQESRMVGTNAPTYAI